MGFKDLLGKVGNVALNAGSTVAKAIVKGINESSNKQNEEIEYHKENLDRYDDERLKKEFETSTDRSRRIAAGTLLKERGY